MRTVEIIRFNKRSSHHNILDAKNDKSIIMADESSISILV